MGIPLVIPCYNEALRLPLADLQAALANDPDLHLLLVDDGSTDETPQLLSGLAARHAGRVVVHTLRSNRGKAEAVRQGMLMAAQRWPDAPYIGFFDADLATPLNEAGRLLQAVSPRTPGLVIGSRVNLFGTTDIRRNNMRHYVGRLSATLVSISLGVGVYDTQCGAKLVRADRIHSLFGEAFLSRWLFDVELIWRSMVLVGSEGLRVELAEVPVSRWHEKGGSKVRFSDGLRVPYELWRIRRAYRGRVM